MAKKIRTVYYVRGGTKSGAYLKFREINTTGTTRKYAWTGNKNEVAYLSYEQARCAIRNTYGGQLVKRVYKNKKLVKEVTIG
jgi:hypothetical protein